MNLEVLISCMNQENLEIVKRSKITTDVLVVNQADSESIDEVRENSQRIRMITTTERGLSRSRNMALKYSQGDICLLCDDDEIFESDYKEKILKSFEKIREADVIAFDVENKQTRLGNKICRIGYLKSLKLSSCQIAFRREAILNKKIYFDIYMGAGSGNGCGEENKFLLDLLRAGIKIYYVPIQIAKLDTNDSTWFEGFDALFFYQRGSATRYMLGFWPSIVYGMYYILVKRELYSSAISSKDAFKWLLIGIRDNNILQQKNKGKNE